MHFADAFQQFLALRVFQQIALGAGFDRVGEICVRVEGCQYDDAG